MPSLAVRMPWVMPRICEVMVDAMARPAASSFALLMRLPVDRRSIAVLSALPAAAEALDARSAEELVPIKVMIIPFRSLSGRSHQVEIGRASGRERVGQEVWM